MLKNRRSTLSVSQSVGPARAGSQFSMAVWRSGGLAVWQSVKPEDQPRWRGQTMPCWHWWKICVSQISKFKSLDLTLTLYVWAIRQLQIMLIGPTDRAAADIQIARNCLEEWECEWERKSYRSLLRYANVHCQCWSSTDHNFGWSTAASMITQSNQIHSICKQKIPEYCKANAVLQVKKLIN